MVGYIKGLDKRFLIAGAIILFLLIEVWIVVSLNNKIDRATAFVEGVANSLVTARIYEVKDGQVNVNPTVIQKDLQQP